MRTTAQRPSPPAVLPRTPERILHRLDWRVIRRLDGQLQHASYVASWLRVLKNDKRAVFTASTKAQQAADFVLAQRRASPSPEAEVLAA